MEVRCSGDVAGRSFPHTRLGLEDTVRKWGHCCNIVGDIKWMLRDVAMNRSTETCRVGVGGGFDRENGGLVGTIIWALVIQGAQQTSILSPYYFGI